MPRLSCAALLTLTLLSTAAAAQPALGIRRLELHATPLEQPLEVQMTPEVSSTFEFDSPINKESVEVESRDLFSLVDVGESTLRLELSDRAQPGDRLRLTVSFRDGALPRSVAFMLVVHVSNAERIVEVARHPRTVDSYRQEARELQAQVEQCLADSEKLRAASEGRGGLTGLIASGAMAEEGVRSKDLTRLVTQSRKSGPQLFKVVSYSSGHRRAVYLELSNPDATEPLLIAGGSLEVRKGEPLAGVTWWQQEPAVVGPREAELVVEVESLTDVEGRSFTLKLWDKGGARTLTLSNVTFP